MFPYPNHKRQLMVPSTNHSLNEALRNKHHDEFVLFEKEPFKMMVINELKKGETLATIDEDASMITNLQNIKQGLKSDYSDKEILNTILLNMNFTDQLIEEHLKLNATKSAAIPKYVPRDAANFRKFVMQSYDSKDREDPYTHFYLKEAKNKEMMNSWISEEKQLQKETELESKSPAVLAEGEQRRKVLQDKIDSLLMEEENRNEDLLQLSNAGVKTHLEVRYDIRTLVKSETVHDVEPELVDRALTDEAYLEQYRRRAEAKLIKSKIIYKLSEKASEELSANEREYLRQWVADVRDRKDRNLANLRDSMVPQTSTKLTIGDIEAKSLYALNSVSRVALERESHGQFSLSDLVVELSHFLDEEVVNKVETEIFSERLRKEWSLSSDFKVIETRNKEISLVLNELEEVAWRSAGMFTEKDMGYLKAMLSVKRNKDSFDR